MATSTTDFMRALVAANRLSPDELTQYNALRSKEVQQQVLDPPYSINLPDNISLTYRSITRNELESVSKVFNTPELLEMILLHLSPTVLMHRASLVCRGFKHAISASFTIRSYMSYLVDVRVRSRSGRLTVRKNYHIPGINVNTVGKDVSVMISRAAMKRLAEHTQARILKLSSWPCETRLGMFSVHVGGKWTKCTLPECSFLGVMAALEKEPDDISFYHPYFDGEVPNIHVQLKLRR